VTGGEPGPRLDLASVEQPLAAARVFARALADHPRLLLGSLVLAAAAAALPLARRRGVWGLAVFALAFAMAVAVPAPGTAAIPLVACVLATVLAVGLTDRSRA
jgi:hypothetical protein